MKRLCQLAGLFALALCVGSVFAQQTWYVDGTTGGPRTSAFNAGVASCTGLGNTPFNPSGADGQPCPFNAPVLLWNDPWHYGNAAWVMAGGDTVIVSNFHTATSPGTITGSSSGSTPGTTCYGVGDTFSCNPPDFPSGTSGHLTRLLGENYASCGTNIYGGDPAKVEYLAAVDAAYYTLALISSQYVDIECLNLNGEGSTAYGIYTGTSSAPANANITLKNVTLQGFQSTGIVGPVGGLWTTTDLEVYMNGESGWNFDSGPGPISTGSVVGSYVGVDWNGCKQEWPLVHPIPVANAGCKDDLSGGGYGDGLGTPVTPLNFSCAHCRATYNTQDAFDFTHMIGGTILVTDSTFAGNMGGNLKMGPGASVTIYNNTVVGNCIRMNYAITGAQAGYNSLLSDFCRAGGDQNGANPLTSSQYVGNTYAVGTTVTGSGTHFTTQLANGNVVGPANFPFSTYHRTVASIIDDTHLTVNTAFPTDWGSVGSLLYLLYTPTGTPSSSSVINWYHNSNVGYGATQIDGACLFGIQAGGGYAENTADTSYCAGYVFNFMDNVNVGIVDQNCNFGNCGSGTTPPSMWGGILPSNQDYNDYYNMVGGPAVGPHDITVTPLFLAMPSTTVAVGNEAVLDGYNFNLASGSGVAVSGVAIAGQTIDAAGIAWSTPPSMGALQFAGPPPVGGGTTLGGGVVLGGSVVIQ